MFTLVDVLVDALWVLGLAGLLATLSYVSWHRSVNSYINQRSWSYAFSVPRTLFPLCLSLTIFCTGLFLNGIFTLPQAPWWEIAAWALLAVLFLIQAIIYGLTGKNRGWNTPIEGKKVMTDPNTNDNWQLRDDGEVEKQWQLLDTEQNLPAQWQLQDDDGGDSDWQPVEYSRPERSSGGWILPSLVIVALVAVVGYTIWIALSRFSPDFTDGFLPGVAQATPPTEIAADDSTPTVVPINEPNVVTEPTAAPTEPPPTAEPTPTAPPLQPQDFATVSSQYGVNARTAPDVNAEIVQLLESNESVAVISQSDDGWVMVFLIDDEPASDAPITGKLAWVSSEFVDITTELMPTEFINELSAATGITFPTPEATTEAEAPTASTEITDTNTAESAVSEEGASPVTVTVTSFGGLNARATASTDGEIVQLLPDGETFTALAVSDDGEWVQVVLDDGQTAWTFAELLTINGDLNTLQAPADSNEEATAEDDSAAAPTSTTPITSTVASTDTVSTEDGTTDATVVTPPVSATQTLTTGIAVEAPYTSTLPADSPSIAVSSAFGVNVRATPDTDSDVVAVVPQGAALPAVGQNADGSWLQITLPDSQSGWVFKDAVLSTADVDTLPILKQLESTAPSATEPITTTSPVDDAPVETEATPPATEETPTATVTAILVPIYPEPNAETTYTSLLASGSVVNATGRTADSLWVQIVSDDGSTGWVDVNTVILSVDIESLGIVIAP